MKKLTVKLTIDETAIVGERTIKINNENPITEDAYFTVTFEKLSEKTKELTDKINDGRIASELKEKDDARDLDIRAIFYEVEAKCMRRESEDRAKAMRVMEVLDRYGIRITDANYGTESSRINAMLSDLKAPELAEDRKAVPELDTLIPNLEESQDAFETSTMTQMKNKAEREKEKPASVIAEELRDIINDELLGYINAMALSQPDKYKPFAEMLNKLIEDTNKRVRDRMAALKRKKEEAEAE